VVAILCIVNIAESYVDVSLSRVFLPAMCFGCPALVFGIAEWFLYFRKFRSLEKPLGVICGIIGVLALVVVMGNAGEAIREGDWLIFGATGISIAAYNLWCCWMRMHRWTFPEERGFPVIPIEKKNCKM
jgi:hypothetical protein